MIKEIKADEFDAEINAKEVVLVKFFGTWCMPCKMMVGILEKVDAKLKGKLNIIKLDVDVNLEVARKYEVLTVPTCIVFKNGEQMEKVVGFRQEQQILDLVTKYLN